MFKEWKAIFKKPTFIIVMIGISLIPALYNIIFLSSMWDPYGKLSELPVAIVNKDQAATYNDEKLTIGEDMVSNLKDSNSLDFHFVDEGEGERGLRDGDYYMVVTLPSNLSEKASSILTNHPEQMTIDYQTSSGHSFIASKMSDSAMTQLKQNVSANVTETYTKALFQKMGDLKSKIESTYTVKVSVTDLILQNLTKKEEFNNVGSRVFNYTKTNPDLNLLVDISSVNYSKPTINVKTAPKEYSEEYVNSEGNKVLNVVKYYENETTKTTALSFVVTYKLVSNTTGEVLFHYKKTIDKSYKESWKNYYMSSFRMNKRKQIPNDEPEKSVPTKEQLYQIAYQEMYDMIQKEINNLPSIK